MGANLPTPVRVAAGLAVLTVEQAKQLPTKLAALPVTVVSHVVSASMRVQHRIAELAIKGDQALSVLRPLEDNPEWAVFDDEPDATPAREPAINGVARVGVARVDVAPTDTPGALPDYDGLSIAALRGHLRTLTIDQLEELLAWETTHQDRPPFVTMLTNRITALVNRADR